MRDVPGALLARAACAWTLALALAAGCGSQAGEEAAGGGPGAGAEPAASPEAGLPEIDPVVERALAPFTGDLPGMRERRMVRVLVTYDKTNFFFANGQPRGFEYELLRGFEKALNAGVGRGELATRVVFLPVPFESLLDSLIEGRGDVAASGLTITPEREARVAFSRPYLRDVDEIVVTGPKAPALEGLEELAGRRVLVARGTSYTAHLEQLSQRLEEEGLAPIEIVEADAGLQSEDVLELVNGGIAPITVVDRHIAELWSEVLPKLGLRPDLVVGEGEDIAWAVRKESPELLKALNTYTRKSRQGTLLGNVLFRRYHEDAQWIVDPMQKRDKERLSKLEPLFRRYADEYDFDWLAIAALAYQESGFDQSKRSRRGAVGIMQVMPSTAADPNVGIPDIETADRNVHAGVKYLGFLRDRYFSGQEIPGPERFDFALAAYNAGPRAVARARRRAEEAGLDPNRWFGNVEVAALQMIGREPVRYVANVNKYYVAYRLALLSESEPQQDGQSAR